MKQANRRGGISMLAMVALLVGGSHLGVAAVGGDQAADSAEASAGARCAGSGGNGDCCRKGKQQRHRGGQGHGAGKGDDHDTIHALLDHHEAIQRQVKEIEGGVETTTTSTDPKVTQMIRKHVRDMKQRVEAGHGMRWWDPTFVELFKHHDKIEMQIEDIEGGAMVRETSSDADVTLLIRQHAIRGVSEFVADGHARARQETPLPDGYGSRAEESSMP